MSSKQRPKPRPVLKRTICPHCGWDSYYPLAKKPCDKCKDAKVEVK